ncbi:hypothetical protein V501_07827 [Pseudogymnoascus sp. VKM F-4519 (FW-2642)]|nr:hypothetical protein V501_07827 [Pseudogymnoascus sp. VKM F-4519 (FW-2642)]
MSSLYLASSSNTKAPSNRLDANNATKQHGIATQRTRTKQYRPSTLHDLPLSANVLRATSNHNHTCAIHGRRRSAVSDPPAPTMPLTASTRSRRLPTPPGVVGATRIGAAEATRRYNPRRSPRGSLEEAFYDCQETSVGFLTPSLNQSHSDPPSSDDDDPTGDMIRILCCYLPKIHLPQLLPISCLGFSIAKGEPMIVSANSHATRANLPARAWRKKSASVANDEAMPSGGNTNTVTTLMKKSMDLIRGTEVGSLARSDSTICRNALFSRGRRTDTVSEIAIKRSSQGNIPHQMELPTIVTLRRAITVLNTLAQPPTHNFSTDMSDSAMLREYRRSIRSMASPAEYLITSEEIRSLKNQMESRFIGPVPKQTALVKEKRSLAGIGWKGRVKKSSSGSMAWFGAPRKDIQSRVALSVSNIHTASVSVINRGRKGYFISQRTSIIPMLMAGKSIHEIVCEDDGNPQNLFSSTWSVATSLAQVDLATWSPNSCAREPDPAPIEDIESYGGGTAIMGINRTFKTVWKHPSEEVSDTPYDIDKSLSLSEVMIPSYVTQQFSICTPKPIADGVWLPPISTFNVPLIEIPAANLRTSALNPDPTDDIWRDYHVSLNAQSKHPLLGKQSLAAPVTTSQPKPSLWGNSTQSLVRVPVGSRPKPSLWSSDVAASGQMIAIRDDRESTAENTPRLWKRASARRLRGALGMGSGESWRRVMGVENIKDAEIDGALSSAVDDRAPWGAETLDDVSIISEDGESDGSWKRDAISRKGKRRLLRRISQRAGRARQKLVAAREEKARQGTENGKGEEGVAQGGYPSERTPDHGGMLEERSKHEELEEWMRSLEATPVLRPRSGRNYMNLYGSSRATDRKTGDHRPLKLEGGSRRSVSITTIV